MSGDNLDDLEEHVKKLYLENEYILKHHQLHEEDSAWKIRKIIPLVDNVMATINYEEINLLDVGGGKGIILNSISNYIKKKYQINTNKIILDLSPGMLEIQSKVNPDVKKALNEDICKTSLKNKEVDITLLIDVLEHIIHPEDALKEIMRISRFLILKVPLEDNLFDNIRNFITHGRLRKNKIKNLGHIQSYNISSLINQLENHNGQIIDLHYTNVGNYNLSTAKSKNKLLKLKYLIENQFFKLSPELSGKIFMDFVVLSVKCY